MANTHLHRVHAPLSHVWYWGRCGATAHPRRPWSERRLALVLALAREPLTVQAGSTLDSPRLNDQQGDLRRLIREGWASCSAKVRSGSRRGWAHRCVQLTERGAELAAQATASPPRVSAPYAKRRDALAELAQANARPAVGGRRQP